MDKQISAAFREWMPMDISFLSSYADILSFVLVLILTGKCAAVYSMARLLKTHMKHLVHGFQVYP